MRSRKKKIARATEEAQLLGLMRIGVGVSCLVLPRLTARAWLAESRASSAAKLALRSLGAREIAIGVGLLAALEKNAPVRGWLEAGVMSDAADALIATGAAGIPASRRLLTIAGAAAAALWGAKVADELD